MQKIFIVILVMMIGLMPLASNAVSAKISITFNGKRLTIGKTLELPDITLKAVKAISTQKISVGKNSSVTSISTIYLNSDEDCVDHKNKAYLEIDMNDNRLFCGNEALYWKYRDHLKVDNVESSKEAPPFKLKLQLKSCNESLNRTQAENQDLQRKVGTYTADKDAQKVKDVIAMQNERLNVQRAEIEELQKQLVELKKTMH